MASIFGRARNVLWESSDVTIATVEARGHRYHANEDLLRRLIRRMNPEVDAVAAKWADNMALVARGYAPRSADSGSNSRGGTPMADTVDAYKTGHARYVVHVAHPAAVYVLGGTRPHIIRAGALGATGTVNRTTRVLERLGRRVDRLERYRAPAKQRINPRTGQPRRRLSQRERNRRSSALAETRRLVNQMNNIGRTRGRALRARGRQMLVFPWNGPGGEGWAQRVNGRVVQNLFVGPVVSHPGTKANNFLLRARARVAPGFYRDLRRLFEGR